ncbi:MAG: hypothetical protein DYH13_03165 [Alphaproteobacteria bacterium PRO2]|nr:hypothetical protein [Alphaproteobacteria bacterium PRO2]
MNPENKSEAELMLEEADRQAEAGHSLEAMELYRKAMDIFPPLDQQKMHDAFLKLATSYARTQMKSSTFTGAKKKTASIALNKALASLVLQTAKTKISETPDIQNALSTARSAMSDLEKLGEGPAKHADLLMTYAEILMLAEDLAGAENNFIKAMNYGADRKKVYFNLTAMFAKLAEHSGGAKERALHYLEAFRQAAQGDDAAIEYARPLARSLQTAQGGPPPLPPSA